METLFLDTETTGKYPGPDGDEALSVAIVDYAGNVLLNTLVRPTRHTSWPDAQKIHSISPADVLPAHALDAELPTLAALTPAIADLLRGNELVVYNAEFDCRVLAEALALGPPAHIECAMLAWAEFVGEWNSYHGNMRWHSLSSAAATVGHQWTGTAHGALPDARACRDVWAYLTDADERGRLEAVREEHRLQLSVDGYLSGVWDRERRATEKAEQVANEAWEEQHFPLMRVLESRWVYDRPARESAAVLCEHLTGYELSVWNQFGPKLLKLRKYGQDKPLPKHLTTANNIHFLRPHWQPGSMAKGVILPNALWAGRHVRQPLPDYMGYVALFDLRKLTVGVDYVPFCWEYKEGYCSKTALVRDHKLKPKEADQVRPAFLLVRKKYDDYLLYPIPTPISQPQTPALVGTETHGE